MEVWTTVGIILVVIILIGGLIAFILNQKRSAKEWLLLAVTEAEKVLGDKMGQLKLRAVFENFMKVFPLLSKIISFETFSKWVDTALTQMKVLAKSNVAMNNYIKG